MSLEEKGPIFDFPNESVIPLASLVKNSLDGSGEEDSIDPAGMIGFIKSESNQLEVFQYLWQYAQNLGVVGVGLIFYHYKRHGNLEVSHQQRIMMPIDAALKLQLNDDWVEAIRHRLGIQHHTPPFSLAATTRMFTRDEFDTLASQADAIGRLGERWFIEDQEYYLSRPTELSLVVADLDDKSVSADNLSEFVDKTGFSFALSGSDRGYHMVGACILRNIEPYRRIEVRVHNRLALALSRSGLPIDARNVFLISDSLEGVLRVTKKDEEPHAPRVKAVSTGVDLIVHGLFRSESDAVLDGRRGISMGFLSTEDEEGIIT